MNRRQSTDVQVRAFRAVIADRAGNILIMFSFFFVGLFLLVGGAIDVSRAVQFRSSLQNAVDAAALAGAADFTSLPMAAHQKAIASDYMSGSVSRLTWNDGVDFSVTPFPTRVDGVVTAYNVRVSATGRINTTFLALVMDAIPVSVESTATTPAIVISTNYDSSSAMPALLPAGDDPQLYNRARNLDIESFGVGLGQVRITQ